MNRFFGLGGAAFGGLFLASCVTYPYGTAFSSCESEANACYRLCEDIPDEGGYVACQAHCDRDIDRCFDQAYSPYQTGYYSGYGYSSPWYGRYGSWYPDTGYFLSFNYYDRYGYRKKRHHPRGDRNWRDGRRDYDDHRDRDGRNGNWRDRDGDRDGDRNWRDRRPGAGGGQPPASGGNAAPPRPAPNATPIPPGERRIDTPRRPNRYDRRRGDSGSISPTPETAVPQGEYRAPGPSPRRVAPPPGASQPSPPAYTPPPRPAYTPPTAPPPQSAPAPAQPAERTAPPPRSSPRNNDDNRQPD